MNRGKDCIRSGVIDLFTSLVLYMNRVVVDDLHHSVTVAVDYLHLLKPN